MDEKTIFYLFNKCTFVPGESMVTTATSSTILHLKCFCVAPVASILEGVCNAIKQLKMLDKTYPLTGRASHGVTGERGWIRLLFNSNRLLLKNYDACQAGTALNGLLGLKKAKE